MQITINASAGGFTIEISNYPFYKHYVRHTAHEVQELITTVLKDVGIGAV